MLATSRFTPRIGCTVPVLGSLISTSSRCSPSSHVVTPQALRLPHQRHAAGSRCQALPDGRDSPTPDKPPSSGGNAIGDLAGRFNSAYVVIFAVFGGLLALRNPYIFAALTILTIIPQNSSNASLNSLVLLFYESGVFMNFAEAVYCVRLVTWLSIVCTLVSFAVFA